MTTKQELSQALLVVLTYLSCVNDAHVHACFACMVQEGRVEGSPHSLIASEGEGHIGHSTADLAARADVLDDLGGPDEVYGIVVVFLHAGAHGEDVGVKNHILRVEANLLYHDPVCPLADAHLYGVHQLKCANNSRADISCTEGISNVESSSIYEIQSSVSRRCLKILEGYD